MDMGMGTVAVTRITQGGRIRGIAVPALMLMLLGWSAFGGAAQAQDVLAIKGGTIVPVKGAPIPNGVILVREGKIQSIGGPELKIPFEAKVIDAQGKTVMPGFVDVHTSAGMGQPNEVNPNVPFISVLDAVDPSLEYFEEALRNGITSAAVVPGNSTMIGGQAAVVKTAGNYVDAMILKRDAGLKISMSPSRGRSRMSHVAALRKELDKTREYIQELADKDKEQAEAKAKDAAKSATPAATPTPAPAGDKPKETPTPAPAPAAAPADAAVGSGPSANNPDAQREAMVKLLKGELPVFLHCNTASDVLQALKLVKEYNLKAFLVLDSECYKARDAVAASKLPVILDASLVSWETDPRTGEEKQIILPKLYREKNIPVTFQILPNGAGGGSYLWYQAATAVKYGTPRDEALEIMTLRPAKLLGIDSFVGSLEPGKDADIVILSGDPLKVDTWVETTVVNGKIAYERSKDAKIQELLNPAAAKPATPPKP